MKKIGLICLALVLALGVLGVGYAMWDKTLTIDGTVATGNVDAEFLCQWTYDNEAGPLYAGTSSPAKVYQYSGDGTVWTDISGGSFANEFAVLDLEEYDCHLYASTMSTDDPHAGVGRVWRYDGGTTWTLVGDNMDDQVCALKVYNEKLYAGTAWDSMNLYRYNDPGWAQVVNYTAWSGTRALHVSHGLLLMGDIGYDRFGHIDPDENFIVDEPDMTGSCNYDYEDYCGDVYASAYVGRLWRSTDAVTWSVVLDYFDGNMWELEVYQAELYMSYANGYLSIYPDYRHPVHTASDGIISMTTDGQYLYFGIGGECGSYYGSEPHTGTGYVYSWDGSTATLISGAMGVGVQVLYVGTECYPYDDIKDVGQSECVISEDGQTITLTLTNVYPCYEATMWYTIVNTGTIPVHIDSIVVDPDPAEVAEITVTGIALSDQIDPISWPGMVPTPGDLHIHVLQDAEQATSYSFNVTINAGQWNE